MKHKYLLVRAAFHGGGIVSQHHTETEANNAKRRWLAAHKPQYQPACWCGCVGVVKQTDYTNLKSNTYDAVAVDDLCRP